MFQALWAGCGWTSVLSGKNNVQDQCWVPGVWLVSSWSGVFVMSGAGEVTETGSVVLFPSLEKEGQCPAFAGLVSFESLPSGGYREGVVWKALETLWKKPLKNPHADVHANNMPHVSECVCTFLDMSGCHWGFWTRLNLCGYFWKCLDVSGFAGVASHRQPCSCWGGVPASPHTALLLLRCSVEPAIKNSWGGIQLGAGVLA